MGEHSKASRGKDDRAHMPSNEIHQSNFEVIPVPLDLCMHLQLLYFAAAVDVVGQRVAPCVRVRGDKVPPERSKSAKSETKATPRWREEALHTVRR